MEEALIKRILPHSIEAEQSVIGSMLMGREAIMAASEILTSDDFYQHQYGVIFDAMVELFNEGKPVDLVTLQNRLREKDVPPEISSMEFVRDLLNAVPTSANVRHYANIVSEKAVLRRLIKLTEEIENDCYLNKEPVEVIMEETEKRCSSYGPAEFRRLHADPPGCHQYAGEHRACIEDEGKCHGYSDRIHGSGLQDIGSAEL